MRVSSFGKAKQGDPLDGAMQCGEGQPSHDENSRCDNFGRNDGEEGQSRGAGNPKLEHQDLDHNYTNLLLLLEAITVIQDFLGFEVECQVLSV